MAGNQTDPRLENALHQMEAAANNFALRTIRMAEVRSSYVSQIREMSQSIRTAVENGEMSAARGAELAHQTRNQIMEMQRVRDFDLGRSLARNLKSKGITLEESIAKAMKNAGFEGRQFNSLTGEQQNRVFMEVVESSGRSRPAVTAGIPRLRWASRGLWLMTLAIAGYNIGTSENPWWQTGREASNIGGGIAGGAAAGAVVGIWAGPVGVAIGVLVGGALGALLADHAYVETVGVGDPATRQFIDRFTSFWTGTDESGIAQALAREYSGNAAFTMRVFQSLDKDYNSDADDTALEYVKIARNNPSVLQLLAANSQLRQLLIRLLDEGWTTSEETNAINFLRGL